ncbi:nad-reducing hydrogenase subunit hoxf [hydrocarbon metagenome]|uniref:Nad-reducing hydrogenase subunit hoxf n=1 Tax=hydrocarbon metagenome TaxID=938273 RepID=A0A0W8E776_9ZZZZ
MMKICSLDDLGKIRNDQSSLNLRMNGGSIEDKIEILVGLATCGISSGARETQLAFEHEIKQQNINNISVVPVGCIGNCYSEPTVQINVPGQFPVIYGRVHEKDVPEIIEKHVKGGTPVERLALTYPPNNKQMRIALRHCGLINPEDIFEYLACCGYEALGCAVTQRSPESIIDEVKKSGLRGRGGGGFPTGVKWQITREQPGEKKYIICNADEGDPGAFMDRSILEGDPHSVLEAMAIGGYALGADQGIIYIRAEYPLAVSRLNIAISQARELGLLGPNIFGSNFSFDIRIKYGAGAFVCGEETALINSCEGKRGEPNYKPPYPAQKGYWGYPTCVNNVETFANIVPIITNGSNWFASIGTEKSKGTKVFALAGKINNVGLAEVPMGITLREMIYEIGGGIKDGHSFKAIQTGGPSGGVISEEYLDTPIDYDNLIEIGSMMGSGGMIVMDETDNMVNMAKFYLEFSMDESCGRCTPCRIGTKRMYEIINKITSGKGSMADLYSLKQLTYMVRDSSLCGLGQSAPNPVISTMKHFWSEYLAFIPDPRAKLNFKASKISRKNKKAD